MKLYRALLLLEKTCPELFSLMKNISIELIDDDNMTAFAARRKLGYKIGINKKWVEETFEPYSIAAVLEHEILHIVFEHCGLLKDYQYPELANTAQDYIINNVATLWRDRTKLHQSLQGCCFLDDLNKQYGTNYSSRDNTSKDIYDFLLSKATKIPMAKLAIGFDKGMDHSQDDKDSDQESSGSEMGEAMDKIAQAAFGVAPGEGEGKKESDKGSEGVKVERGELKDQKFIGIGGEQTGGVDGNLDPEDMQNVIKSYSRNSAELRKYFENIEKLNKNKKIREAIEKFFSSNKESFKRSIKRLNKRFKFIPYGRIAEKKQRALVALDVSGSMMNPDDLAKLKMVVNSAVGNGFLIDLIFGDTRKLGEFKDIKPNFDFNKIHGGGGTDLKFIFKGPVKDYDVVVVATDGCFDHDDVPTSMKGRILFLITSGYYTKIVEGFKNIKI